MTTLAVLLKNSNNVTIERGSGLRRCRGRNAKERRTTNDPDGEDLHKSPSCLFGSEFSDLTPKVEVIVHLYIALGGRFAALSVLPSECARRSPQQSTFIATILPSLGSLPADS